MAVDEEEEEEGRGLGEESRGEGWRGSRGEVREDSLHPPESTCSQEEGRTRKTVTVMCLVRNWVPSSSLKVEGKLGICR